MTYVAPGCLHGEHQLILFTLIFLIAQKSQLGISGFGISVTTMEEVFIKVGENSIEEITDVDSRSTVAPLLTNSTSKPDTVITGYSFLV